MSATELPAFLWEDNGKKYDKEDMCSGLFRGFYLERASLSVSCDCYSWPLLEQVARHIFTGPSTAHGGESRAVRSCNAILHRMDKVEAAHIAYAAVLVGAMNNTLIIWLTFTTQARFGISSQSRWSEKDGCFNYHNFYYITQDVINECEDVQWKESLLKHYNM